MTEKLSTEGVGVEERPEWWAHQMRERFGLDSRVEPMGWRSAEGMADFHQSVVTHDCGNVHVASRLGSPVRASWQAHDSNLVFADINIDGHCIQKHNGHPEILLMPRSICVFPLADSGTVFYPESTRHFILVFPGDLLSSVCPGWQKHAGVALPADGGAAGMLLDWTAALHANLDTDGQKLGKSCRQATGHTLISLLGSALGAAEEGDDAQSSRLRGYHRQRIRQFILNNLADPELTVTSIASRVGLSPRYLHSLFADDTLSLMQWVQEQRLLRSRAELAAPTAATRTIAQIAYACGFNDAAHFSRSFQKRFAVSPREFRAGLKHSRPR